MSNLHQSEKLAHWMAVDVARIDIANAPTIPLIRADEVHALVPGVDLWDSWPIQTRAGSTADFDGTTLWMMLSSPALPDPAQRHDQARIRLLAESGGIWTDCGNLLPDGFGPGTREWAGSAIVDDDGRTVTLFYTATGRPGAPPSFEQRLFETSGTLSENRRSIESWRPPTQIVASDNLLYVDTRLTGGAPGMIKGFRDPGYFRDPADGHDYLVFTGSDAQPDSAFNGVVGIIHRENGGWTLQAPIYSATGLCNELERPHIIYRGGRYYLFWSTQHHVFAPSGPAGPNGLYGAVAPSLHGPYRPLNGTGLVAANPAAEPTQSYSWLVLDDLSVVSFVDYWGMGGARLVDHPGRIRSHFGGTAAPVFRIELENDVTRIVS
jgi:levansucrase